MNRRQLAMRDPALASLVGAIGANFGHEHPSISADFGEDFGDDFGEGDMHGEFGDDYGAEFGDDYGVDFGDEFGAAAPAALATTPSPRASQALWRKYRGAKARSMRRAQRLHPNMGSSFKLEEFSFPLNPATNPVFGAASAANMTNNPDVTIRPERIVFNVPSVGLYIVAEVKTANVGCLVGGSATQDAGIFSPLSVGMRISCPTLTPSNRLTIVGNWTALVPAGGFVNGVAFPLGSVALGPAKMAG